MVSWLSISNKKIKSCDEVLQTMRALKIVGDVTQNASIDEKGEIEVGCRILVAGHEDNVKHLWHNLSQMYDLKCAHVSIVGDNKNGCVLDVFRPSNCPSRIAVTSRIS